MSTIIGSNAGLEDLQKALKRLPLAFYFAWSDTKARSKRSALGPFWMVLSTLVGVVGLGLDRSTLLKVDRAEFMPSLTIGLIVWQMISGCLSEAPALFSRQAAQIKNINMPSFLISIQLVMRNLINFAHNLLVFLLVVAVYPEHVNLTIAGGAEFLFGLVLLVINLVWVTQMVGYLGARYRDLEPLVTSSLPILFFLSPVIYRTKQLGALETIMGFNPIAYWIAIVRDPVLGVAPELWVYGVALATTALGWTLTLWLTATRRRRLPYWL